MPYSILMQDVKKSIEIGEGAQMGHQFYGLTFKRKVDFFK